MIFKELLLPLFRRAIAEEYPGHKELSSGTLTLQPTSKGFRGTHTFVIFPLANLLKEPLDQIGEKLGVWLLRHSTHVANFEVVKGFLNLTLTQHTWLDAFQKHLEGNFSVAVPKKFMLEIASPNTNKPLHLGHLRNSFIGDAVANILRAVGHDVKKIIHINDRGIHICKSMYAYQRDKKAQTPEAAHKKGDHLVGHYYVKFDEQYKAEVAALSESSRGEELDTTKVPCMVAIQEMLRRWEAGDPEIISLWKRMNGWVYAGFAETYAQLGIAFDKWYYESETYVHGKNMVKEGLKRGIFYRKKDGSIWANLEVEGLGAKLLLRADGTSVYITQDLGTADLRANDFKGYRSIYVVGDEQDHHFKVLFAILQQLKRPYADKLFHLSYGMVDLPTGKMKSREGTVVEADDLIAKMLTIAKQKTDALGKLGSFDVGDVEKLYYMLAVGALKFFLVALTPQKRICFDPNKSIDFQGRTAAFIQYTHARIATMLQKADTLSINYGLPSQLKDLLPIEFDLIGEIVALCGILHEAAQALNPAICAQYLYGLAKTFNRFYTQVPILQASTLRNKQKRLLLSYCTLQNLQCVSNLLGIQLPTKM